MAFIPMAVLGPLAGILADRYSRKVICIVSDLSTAAVAVVFALIVLAFDPPAWIALVVLLLRGIAGTFQGPAFQAMTPQYVPAEELLRAGGWTSVISSASFVLGPVIGAVLYAAFPLWAVLLSDLVGALASSAMLFIAKVPELERPAQVEAADTAEPGQKQDVLAEFKEGIDVFRQRWGLLVVLVSSTLSLVFYLPLSSFYPLMTSNYFAASAWHASAVEAAFAIGMLVAAALFGSVVKVRRHLLVSYIGMLGISATCIVCGIVPPTMLGWTIFAVSCGFMGAFGNVYSVPLVAYMQMTVDPLKMGRAFSVYTIVSALAMPVGLAIAAPVAEFVGVNTWFLISGLGMLAINVAAILASKGHLGPTQAIEATEDPQLEATPDGPAL